MTQQAETREGHPYFMHDAIVAQPQAIQDMLGKHADQTEEVAAMAAGKRRLHLVGIGTSWHAALVAETWFRRLVGESMQVQAWHSFEFYSSPPRLTGNDTVVIISHRGTKTYSFLALEMAKAAGAFVVCVTSTGPGPRVQTADVMLQTVEPERSAAFTISYTTALSVLAMLALAMGERTGDEEALPSLRASLGEVPGKIAEVLARSNEVDQAAVRFQAQRRFICAGWGGNAANSYEVALKIKETSGCDAEGLQIEQLLHGPFCSVNSECLVTLMSPPGAGYERAKNIARASAEVGAPVWALVQRGDSDLTALATETFTLPEVDEFWSPLVYVAPLQLFTYYLALARGRHPDLFQQDNPAQAAARKHYDL